jgi:hypothetical protein
MSIVPKNCNYFLISTVQLTFKSNFSTQSKMPPFSYKLSAKSLKTLVIRFFRLGLSSAIAKLMQQHLCQSDPAP